MLHPARAVWGELDASKHVTFYEEGEENEKAAQPWSFRSAQRQFSGKRLQGLQLKSFILLTIPLYRCLHLFVPLFTTYLPSFFIPRLFFSPRCF